jgi:serine phosphatase RsbU (regulator of sigma subunit)/integral membrane sensor domain MASE1/anti-sigma regulatory factor (Ser/Thr protein kinase)
MSGREAVTAGRGSSAVTDLTAAVVVERSHSSVPDRDGSAFLDSRWSGLAAWALVAVAYYLGARVGLSLSLVERNVTPLWPPTGIALAAFLLIGRRVWPAVAVAALAVNLPLNDAVAPAVLTAVGNTLAPLLAAVLLQRVGFRRQLDRGRDALALVFLAALGSMLVSATIGTAALVLSGAITSDRIVPAWAVWWTGDAMGVLAVAPFLLCLPLFRELVRWSTARAAEAALILSALAVVSVWVTLHDLPLLFLVLVVLGWAAWRLQLRGAAPAALVASLVATWAATRDRGPFEGHSLFEQMAILQAFNSGVALASFFLSALVTERIAAARALEAAATELEARVEQRTTALSTANARLLQEIHDRSVAQEQLSREELRATREHQIAETLQRSLLPDRLPEIPGVDLAARYVPATADVHVGGDWYDVVQLPGGLIGLAIGDVTGHGLQAAATMGQLRMALRAYALHDPSPVEVLRGVHQLVTQLAMPDMATLIYLVFDPDTRQVRFANAGHPPALVMADGASWFLVGGLAPPVGVTADDHYEEASLELPPGATLLLYTDGLVERRGVSIQDGLDRLALQAAEHSDSDLEHLCDQLLSALLGDTTNADDIALVAMRTSPRFAGPLELLVAAEPQELARVRRTLRRWLRDTGVPPTDENEILVACGEASANVVQHAYDGRGQLAVAARLDGDVVVVTVSDRGRWRAPAERGGGWGFSLMEALVDVVEIDRRPSGTVVTLRRSVRLGDMP